MKCFVYLCNESYGCQNFFLITPIHIMNFPFRKVYPWLKSCFTECQNFVRKWKKILYLSTLFIFVALTFWQNIPTFKNLFLFIFFVVKMYKRENLNLKKKEIVCRKICRLLFLTKTCSGFQDIYGEGP